LDHDNISARMNMIVYVLRFTEKDDFNEVLLGRFYKGYDPQSSPDDQEYLTPLPRDLSTVPIPSPTKNKMTAISSIIPTYSSEKHDVVDSERSAVSISGFGSAAAYNLMSSNTIWAADQMIGKRIKSPGQMTSLSDPKPTSIRVNGARGIEELRAAMNQHIIPLPVSAASVEEPINLQTMYPAQVVVGQQLQISRLQSHVDQLEAKVLELERLLLCSRQSEISKTTADKPLSPIYVGSLSAEDESKSVTMKELSSLSQLSANTGDQQVTDDVAFESTSDVNVQSISAHQNELNSSNRISDAEPGAISHLHSVTEDVNEKSSFPMMSLDAFGGDYLSESVSSLAGISNLPIRRKNFSQKPSRDNHYGGRLGVNNVQSDERSFDSGRGGGNIMHEDDFSDWRESEVRLSSVSTICALFLCLSQSVLQIEAAYLSRASSIKKSSWS
jgi:hypothetical protein